jgi:hypothetical protein
MEYLERKKVEIVDNCKQCHGTNTACVCHENFAFEVKKFSSGIPPLLCNLSSKILSSIFENKAIKDFLNGDIIGLFIEGGTKLKRAELLADILIRCLHEGESIYYINSSDWIQLVTDTWWGKKCIDYEEIVRKDVIGFNDVGDERRTENTVVESIFDAILRDRLYGMKKIILASSIPLETFVDIYAKERIDLIVDSFKVITLPQEKLENLFKEIRK